MPYLSALDEALTAILDALFDGVALVAPPNWRIVYANSVLEQWLQRSAKNLCGKGLESIFHSSSIARVAEAFQSVSKHATTANPQSTIDLSLHDENLGAIQVRICPVQFGDAVLVALILHRQPSVSAALPVPPERRDPLTGLRDREFLFERLTAALSGERSADRHFAILFIDLDNFKQINDEYGHLTGDGVLREVARRLSGCVREEDHVVRYGGDEFVVVANRVSGAREIRPLVERIRRALASPIILPQGTFHLSLSIGVAEPAPHHRTPEDLLREADRAMYAAKRREGESTEHTAP